MEHKKGKDSVFSSFKKKLRKSKDDQYDSGESGNGHTFGPSVQLVVAEEGNTEMINAWNQKFRAVKACKGFLARCKRPEDKEELEFVIKILSESQYVGARLSQQTSLTNEFSRRGTTQDVQEYILKNMIGNLQPISSEDEEAVQKPPPLKKSTMSQPELRAKMKQIEKSVTPQNNQAQNPNDLKTKLVCDVMSMQKFSLIDEETGEEEGSSPRRLKQPVKQQVEVVNASYPVILDEDKLKAQLAFVNEWDKFDVFEVARLCSSRPLVVVALHLFKNYRLLEKCNIQEQVAINFFTAIENTYPSSNPYHCSTHGTDVLQTLNALLVQSKLIDSLLPIQLLAAFVSAAVHDSDHPAVSNNFLIQIGHDIAITYNDISVLENHHLATFFRILKIPGCNIFQNLSIKQNREVRKIIIQMVLATDIAKHVEMLDDFNSYAEVFEPNKPIAAESKLLLLRLGLHFADVSNPAKPVTMCKEWANRIMEEFFFQGDLEESLGLPVSKECDRNNAVKENVQIGFIDFIVRPLLQVWARIFPGLSIGMTLMESNCQHWRDCLAERTKKIANE